MICTFIPSFVSENCSYQLSCTGPFGTELVDAECVGGVCTAAIPVRYEAFSMAALIQQGGEARNVLLATDVSISSDMISWIAAE